MTESEKKERIKEQNRKAQKKYSEKTVNFAIKYTPTNIKEAKRLKAYLESTNQKANSYIKSLIKADLDNKGVPYTD